MSTDTILAMPDLLRTTWTQPRATIRWVQEHGDRGLWGLILAAALVQVSAMFLLPAILIVLRATETDARAIFSALAFLGGLFLIFAMLAGFGALLVVWRVFAGRRPVRDVLRALGWGLVPMAAELPITLGFLVAGNPDSPGAIYPLALLAFGFWGFALSASTLAEVHGVTTSRGLAIHLGVLAVMALLVLGPVFAMGAGAS